MQPFKLADVVSALTAIPGFPGITVSEVKGFGRIPSRNAHDRDGIDFVEYAIKVKLEVAVPEDMPGSTQISIFK